MKVRIGISRGPAGSPDQFAGAVDQLEQAGVDSLWLPETVYSPVVEPFTGMAFALARTRRLKAGSGISALPGRHPVLVAKQLASLAGLAARHLAGQFGARGGPPEGEAGRRVARLAADPVRGRSGRQAHPGRRGR